MSTEKKFDVEELMRIMTNEKCSDLHITVGTVPMLRKDGILVQTEELSPGSGFTEKLDGETIARVVEEMAPADKWNELLEKGQSDFSYSIAGVGRFRVNGFRQRGHMGLAIRAVPFNIPAFRTLNIPEAVLKLNKRPYGLILVTGPTGSGKSTTIASMIDLINEERKCHIITIEDPIEYLHKHKNSIVNQRELGIDTHSFNAALRAVLRQDPDVILVGELRDLETIETALTAAETGHLVFATLHTNSAVQTVDRLIDVFPAVQQKQVRLQLAAVLQGVLSQRLLPLRNGGRTAAVEVLFTNNAIRNLIRDEKTHQLYNVIQTSAREGMVTMETSVKYLLNRGLITTETALKEIPDDPELNRSLLGREVL